MNLKLNVIVACLMLLFCSSAESQEDPPEFFSSESLGHGFQLQYARTEPFYDSLEGDVEVAVQSWRQDARSPAEVKVRFGVFKSREQAKRAWARENNRNLPGTIETSDQQLGDAYVVYNDMHYRFIKGNVVATITALYDHVLLQEQNDFFPALMSLAISRADEISTISSDSSAIDFISLSDGFPPEVQVVVSNQEEGEVFVYQYQILDTDSYSEFDSDLRPVLHMQAPAPLPSSRVVSPDLSSLVDVEGPFILRLQVINSLGNWFTHELRFSRPEQVPKFSLRATQDTTLSLRHNHQNEGSNNLLTLEKIQGKATRSAVGFDLSNVELGGLSKATLVLTIASDEQVNGWGNGRTITAQALTAPWEEGNGRSFGLKKKDAVSGSGSGATWFSPVDADISNDSANGVLTWNGGATNAPTAPAVTITNHQTGEVSFDVTSDILSGGSHGWLVSKVEENVGSKVSFYSKEGAVAAGSPELAPRLILEYGQPIASAAPSGLLAKMGMGSNGTKLRPVSGSGELRSIREVLQESPTAALLGEQFLSHATQTLPVLNVSTRVAYRSWLAEGLQLATNPPWSA